MPLRVRLRVRQCTTQRVRDRLHGRVEVLDRGETRLLLAVSPEHRAELIHGLDGLRDVIEEVEIESPGLEALYRHLTRKDATCTLSSRSPARRSAPGGATHGSWRPP